MSYMLIIICAPSGSGKSTMVQHLLSTYPGRFELSVSCTTRAPRGQEVDGREYYFISREDFEQKIQEGAFIEHEQVYEGLYYGTLYSEIDRIQSKGAIPIFDVDVKGGIHLEHIFGDKALSIFVCPPSIEELSRRLHSRGDTSEEMIQKRLAKASIEMEDAKEFDIQLVNDNLSSAFQQLEKIIDTYFPQSHPKD